jgi:nanoRNase/pAp phosphatase (c-di-AMP/oligoRNAs hydrolase)
MLDSTKLQKPGYQPIYQNKGIAREQQPNLFMGQVKPDTVSFRKPVKNNVIAFGSRGKESVVVTFTGLKDPLKAQKPALQMKVRGVMAHQYISNSPWPPKDFNVNRLAGEKVIPVEKDKYETVYENGKKIRKYVPGKKLIEKDDSLPRWHDGQKLDFYVQEGRRKSDTPRIILSVPGIGEIGRVHDEIAEVIMDGLQNHPDDYRFELSNIVAGTTKGAETAGMRVNLKYVGTDPVREDKAREAFNIVLNNPECSDKVLLYQEKTSPEDVLKLILDYENKVNGPEEKAIMEQTIGNIVKELKNPAHKRILLVGHCKPDGDTIGSVLGLKNALALMSPEKDVDCAIDDKIPGLFRHKMPGIDGEMKRPFNAERLQQIDSILEDLKAREQTNHVKRQIQMINQEKQDIESSLKMLDEMSKIEGQIAKLEKQPGSEKQVAELKEKHAQLEHDSSLIPVDKQYDMVISMDVPTPKRFTNKFKQYYDNANKVIYIDHHPHRLDEWAAAQDQTGLKIRDVHDQKLAWIADAVPAATQLIAIIGNKMLPDLVSIGNGEKKAADVFKSEEQQNHLKAYVASLITGASTDTGSYTRTANLLPEHITDPKTGEPVPVQKRPNFLPEGMSKWLMNLTDGLKDAIDKKWLREEITWDISSDKVPELNQSAHEIMLKHAINGKEIKEDLSLGIIEIDYDKMTEVWDAQLAADKDTTLLDIQNAYKYSEAMGVLRSDPALSGQGPGKPGSEDDGTLTGTETTEELRQKAKANYQGAYDNDRIAILIAQDKKAGELDEKLQLADQNGLRLSLRSVEGSIHAEMLASLFGGGGHGGAAGGRVDLPGVTLQTPLAVSVNGQIERDFSKVLADLHNNYKVMHNTKLTTEQRQQMVKEIKVVEDKSGVPCKELIANVVTEIRKNQPKVEAESKPQSNRSQDNNNHNRADNHHGKKGRKKKKHPHFAGQLASMFNQKVS